MLKKFLITTILAVPVLTNAQVVTRSFDSEEMQQLLKSKTMMVLTGDKDYDAALKDAAQKYWTITPFDFVTIQDAEAQIADKSKSFLLPFLITVTHEHVGANWKDYMKVKSWLSLINGGEKKIKNYSDAAVLALSGFNYWGDEVDYTSAAYRLDFMVKGINDGVKITLDKKLTGNAAKMPFNVIDEINKKSVEALKGKTLLVNKDTKTSMFNKSQLEEKVFKGAAYPYKYKFVSDAEFKAALKGNAADVLCLVPAIEVHKHLFVYDPSTRETLYYGWAIQGVYIKDKDIKSMSLGER